MGYQNWPGSRASLAIYADWYEVPKLLQTLQEIKHRHIFTGNNVYAALELLNTAIVNAPYSRYNRFPQHVSYISDAFEPWGSKLTQLRVELLGYNPEKENNILLCCDAVTKIFRNAMSGEGVLDQSEFELWGGVIWPPHPGDYKR